ncbi:hypothetical protein EJB05_28523, partial [Eragrostis curvula]
MINCSQVDKNSLYAYVLLARMRSLCTIEFVIAHISFLSGWSHYAQFTLSLLNSDTTKSKFSDILHRFWMKEPDWGWRKYIERSKLHNGFVNDDVLTIRAQIQFIREMTDRPFCCLDRL